MKYEVTRDYMGFLGFEPYSVEIEADCKEEAARVYAISRDDWTDMDTGNGWLAIWVRPFDGLNDDAEMISIGWPIDD